jgi:hypothetical protein
LRSVAVRLVLPRKFLLPRKLRQAKRSDLAP